MAAYDIWWATFIFGRSNYRRPCVMIDERGDRFGCFPISTACYEGDCFKVAESDPDFKATGLPESSYIHTESIYELATTDLGKRMGRLEGDLLERFKEHTGL